MRVALELLEDCSTEGTSHQLRTQLQVFTDSRYNVDQKVCSVVRTQRIQTGVVGLGSGVLRSSLLARYKPSRNNNRYTSGCIGYYSCVSVVLPRHT